MTNLNDLESMKRFIDKKIEPLNKKISMLQIELTNVKNQLNIAVFSHSELNWFNKLTLEEQFYKTIEHNGLIAGDNTRHPSTLTSKEIETIYLADA